MRATLPHFDLDWTLRVDASKRGVAAALLMKIPQKDGSFTIVPIAFASQKFSPQAEKWSPIQQESYACYFGCKIFSYYLACKFFTLQTDHNNLLFMEALAVSSVPSFSGRRSPNHGQQGHSGRRKISG